MNSMTASQPTQLLGSNAWLGATNLEPGSESHTRTTLFFAAVNWDAISITASKHRNGIRCKLLGNFSVGYYNMTRRLTFDDGESWVARVRMPLEDGGKEGDELPVQKTMEMEVATMRFLR